MSGFDTRPDPYEIRVPVTFTTVDGDEITLTQWRSDDDGIRYTVDRFTPWSAVTAVTWDEHANQRALEDERQRRLQWLREQDERRAEREQQSQAEPVATLSKSCRWWRRWCR